MPGRGDPCWAFCFGEAFVKTIDYFCTKINEPMSKRFNITGTCIPERHYMADVSNKLRQTLDMVKLGEYFIINRPRQFGKTTMLVNLQRTLVRSSDFFPITISFEALGEGEYASTLRFGQVFLGLLSRELAAQGNTEVAAWLEQNAEELQDFPKIGRVISDLVLKFPKKLVLLIDEVDKSGNNEVFLHFLGMLRSKYLDALRGSGSTFHSVILAGVHDVKTLKIKLRPDAAQTLNSPWNIATDFEVDMSLSASEIIPMLEEYSQDAGIQIDALLFAEKLVWYTSGHPFLVSKLCKMLAEKIIPAKGTQEWTLADLEYAASELVKESNTNFDSLIKNLESYRELQDLVFELVMNERSITYNIHNPVITLGMMYGYLANGRGLRIHNRIYAELIYNYFSSKLETSYTFRNENVPVIFQLPNRSLDMPKVLDRFQRFMKEQYSKKDRDFLERQGRLIFLAFIKPIINGGGYDFKEPEIFEERRIDVAITYYAEKYVVELKIWHGEAAHQEGLTQLLGYLDRVGLDMGYLVIFDHSEVKSWKQEWIEVEGKRILAVWV